MTEIEKTKSIQNSQKICKGSKIDTYLSEINTQFFGQFTIFDTLFQLENNIIVGFE